MQRLFESLNNARIFDLAQPLFTGMPHFPTHPPFLYSLNKLHGDFVTPGGTSSAAETITLGGHTGTHIDALSHFSCGGVMYGGEPPLQSYSHGVEPHGVDTISPILRRGVLIDIASHFRLDALPPEFAITPEQIEETLQHQHVDVQQGDIVLFRTGWAKYWRDPKMFVTGGQTMQPTGPGPELEAARWLSSRKVFAAGSDTIAFERVPAADMPVHVHLLVESGIHIVECLNLEELSEDRVYEFLFVAAPLRISGATGSPMRPFAVVTAG